MVWHAVLQVHAQAHSDAHAATKAKAEQLAARAEAHGQAQVQAVEAAHRLKRVASMGEQTPIAACVHSSHLVLEVASSARRPDVGVVASAVLSKQIHC